MATRFVHKGLDLSKSPYGNVAPFGVNSDGRLQVNRGANFKGALTADPEAEIVQVNRTIVATGNITLTKADAGCTVLQKGTTTSYTVTLPATELGQNFRIVVAGLAGAGAGHAIAPAAADKFIGAGLSKADAAALVCSAGSDVIGDAVELVADGVDGYYIAFKTGTWA